MDNIDNTFVTPVFNGSTSLRNAAGYLIENTVRSVQRKATIDDEFVKNLIENTKKLYRLDQIGAGPTPEDELGTIGTEAVILISTLGIVWLGIGTYLIVTRKKKVK